MLRGFGLLRHTGELYSRIGQKGVKDLTCISNNAGVDDFGIGLMLKQNR